MYNNMETQKSSRIAFLFGIIAAILPLSISFSNGEILYFVSSPVNVAFCFFMLGIALYLIVCSQKMISNRKVTALAILYLLVPFSFRFSESGVQFLILHHSPLLSLMMIVIGSGLLMSLLKHKRNQDMI